MAPKSLKRSTPAAAAPSPLPKRSKGMLAALKRLYYVRYTQYVCVVDPADAYNKTNIAKYARYAGLYKEYKDIGLYIVNVA